MSSTNHSILHLGSTSTGYSKPQLIRLSNKLVYVVKFKNNPTGTRVLVNEYVAAKIAQLLGLPVPPFQIVPISEEFIKNTPPLAELPFEGGNQFASLYIENALFLSDDMIRTDDMRIRHSEVLAGVILFDLWLGNTDRKGNNVLLIPKGNGAYQFYMIDHGRCFANSNWTVKTLSNVMMRMDLKVHKWCYSRLNGRKELIMYLNLIQSVPEWILRKIVFSIPDDWNVSLPEREALLTYLISAKKKLPDTLAAFLTKTGSA